MITRYRDTRANLRTQAHRIIRRAGLVPWPKVFHNMRSSRQTELSMSHPIHQVCAWIGNSEAVAMDHYLQVRDEDINEAVAKAAQESTQKPTWQPRAPPEVLGNEKQRNGPESERTIAQTPLIAALIRRFQQVSDPDKTQKAPRAGDVQHKDIPIIYSHSHLHNAKTDFFEETVDSETIDLNKEVESLPPELQAAVLGILMSNHRKRG